MRISEAARRACQRLIMKRFARRRGIVLESGVHLSCRGTACVSPGSEVVLGRECWVLPGYHITAEAGSQIHVGAGARLGEDITVHAMLMARKCGLFRRITGRSAGRIVGLITGTAAGLRLLMVERKSLRRRVRAGHELADKLCDSPDRGTATLHEVMKTP